MDSVVTMKAHSVNKHNRPSCLVIRSTTEHIHTTVESISLLYLFLLFLFDRGSIASSTAAATTTSTTTTTTTPSTTSKYQLLNITILEKTREHIRPVWGNLMARSRQHHLYVLTSDLSFSIIKRKGSHR